MNKISIDLEKAVFKFSNNGVAIEVSEFTSLHVVVVASAPDLFRQYYKDPFVENRMQHPICWSSNSRNPDPEVEKPQHRSCILCDKNIKGSGEGLTRACKYRQRICVVKIDNLQSPLWQVNLAGPSIFNVDREEQGYKAYCKYIQSSGQSVSGVVTDMYITDAGCIAFKPIRHCNRDEWLQVRELSKSDKARECITKSGFGVKDFTAMQKVMGMAANV